VVVLSSDAHLVILADCAITQRLGQSAGFVMNCFYTILDYEELDLAGITVGKMKCLQKEDSDHPSTWQ